MKVALNKYFIEGKYLTTEQKLQVIEDKIKEAQKELLEEILNYDDSNTSKHEQIVLNVLRLNKKLEKQT